MVLYLLQFKAELPLCNIISSLSLNLFVVMISLFMNPLTTCVVLHSCISMCLSIRFLGALISSDFAMLEMNSFLSVLPSVLRRNGFHLLVMFVASDILPIFVVESEHFKHLLECLNSSYAIPSRPHFTENFLKSRTSEILQTP